MRGPTLLCALCLVLAVHGVAALTPADFKGKHVILFITDQERYTQHFPVNWERQNLPGLTRLKRTGVSFTRAYTTSCMCSAARASLFTGYMPAQSSVHYTLETDMPSTAYPQNALPKPVNVPGKPRNAIANLAQMAKAAGYKTVYKGKWHLVKPATGNYTQQDLANYGYARWNPPDAGADQSLPEGGGNPEGSGNNNLRFMNSTGAPGSVNEGVLQYIRETLPKEKVPVFLVVSIVNPHDVLFYPNQFTASGYNPAMLTGTIKPPATANESLVTKPSAQQFYQKMVVGNLGPDQSLEQQTKYINFYGNLIKESDAYLVNLLNTLDAVKLTGRTVIVRTADHGEMGVAHGTLIQKNFNMYEEGTKIPMVFSNPKLWPKPKESCALVSHIDFAPTLQALLGVPGRFKTAGVDYSSVVLNPDTATPPQNYVMFTYGDFQSGQNTPPYPPGASFIRGIREQAWKIAMYYSLDGSGNANVVQWECYNIRKDPLEIRNIGHPGARLSRWERDQFSRLKARLLRETEKRLGPIPGFQWDIDLNAALTAQPANTSALRGGGTALGMPIGRGKMAILWQPAKAGKAEGTLAVTARTGQISGTVQATVTKVGNSLKYVGAVKITGAIGAYRGFTNIPGMPLTLTMTSKVGSAAGLVTIKGRVTSAAVSGKLTLTPL